MGQMDESGYQHADNENIVLSCYHYSYCCSYRLVTLVVQVWFQTVPLYIGNALQHVHYSIVDAKLREHILHFNLLSCCCTVD